MPIAGVPAFQDDLQLRVEAIAILDNDPVVVIDP
jgi:hypothetical protein